MLFFMGIYMGTQVDIVFDYADFVVIASQKCSRRRCPEPAQLLQSEQSVAEWQNCGSSHSAGANKGSNKTINKSKYISVFLFATVALASASVSYSKHMAVIPLQRSSCCCSLHMDTLWLQKHAK